MTDEDCKRLADERGYREEFCRWLRDEKLIGLHKGQFAFPVHDEDGDVISCHYRGSDGGWFYDPKGNPINSLIVGDPATAKTVLPFESQWDAFAFMERMDWDSSEAMQSGFAIIITRGARNGKRVRGLIPVTATVIAVMQNDPLKEDGSPGAAEGWLDDVVEAVNRRVYVLRPPEQKDLNDWTRAGATRGDIKLAWGRALKNGVGEVRKTEATAPQANAAPAPEVARREFPTDALGPILARFVREVARVERVPEGLVACCVLGVLSSALGKQLRGRLLPGKTTSPNLYVLAAALSGVGKSEVCRRCDRPLHSYAIALVEKWKRDVLPGLLTDKEMFQEQKRKLLRNAKAGMPAADESGLRDRLTTLQEKLNEIEDKLIEPQLTTEDVTTQRLGMLLHMNQEQLCVLSRDAGDVINNLMGRNQKIVATDDSLYVKGYSLDPSIVDRVGRPRIQLPEPCLSVLLMTQPDKLDRLLKNRALRDGGLMPRFLIHCTEALPQHMDVSMPSFDPALNKEYTQLVDSLIRSFRCSTEQPAIVDATPEARMALVNYHNAVVDRRLVGDKSMESFAARHAEQACRLALVLHAAKHGSEAGQHPVDLNCASRAIEITEWFVAEQLVLLTGSSSRSEADLKEAVMALAQKEKFASSGIGARDVQRAKIVNQAVQAMDLLDELVTEKRLELMPPSLTGKGGPRYRLPAT